jgi:hypothetical protein
MPNLVNAVNTLPTYLFKINFNIILPSTLGSSKMSLEVRFSNVNPDAFLCPQFLPHDPPVSSPLF